MSIWQRFKSKLQPPVAAPPPEKSSLQPSASATGKLPASHGPNRFKYIIAIASGKGGVGKSTVTSNLALMLKAHGFQVGLLDADIYGPSQPILLGKKQKAEVDEGMIVPLESHGVKFISMAAVGPQQGPMVVRSPIALKALSQFLVNVRWGALDYLLIDLPPGTGDIQLTLAQKAQLTGVIVVTTPQRLAAEIAKKSIEMFKKVNVPVLGVVENMSGYTCTHCHQTSSLFKQGGGAKLAEMFKLPLLGRLPLDPELMRLSDLGQSIIESQASKPVRVAFEGLTQAVIEQVAKYAGQAQPEEPKKVVLNEKNGWLEFVWADNQHTSFSPYDLRLHCSCASCKDEFTGEPLLEASKIDKAIQILSVKKMGRYGVAIKFSDGHSTGIYRYQRLRQPTEILAQ